MNYPLRVASFDFFFPISFRLETACSMLQQRPHRLGHRQRGRHGLQGISAGLQRSRCAGNPLEPAKMPWTTHCHPLPASCNHCISLARIRIESPVPLHQPPLLSFSIPTITHPSSLIFLHTLRHQGFAPPVLRSHPSNPSPYSFPSPDHDGLNRSVFLFCCHLSIIATRLPMVSTLPTTQSPRDGGLAPTRPPPWTF